MGVRNFPAQRGFRRAWWWVRRSQRGRCENETNDSEAPGSVCRTWRSDHQLKCLNRTDRLFRDLPPSAAVNWHRPARAAACSRLAHLRAAPLASSSLIDARRCPRRFPTRASPAMLGLQRCCRRRRLPRLVASPSVYARSARSLTYFSDFLCCDAALATAYPQIDFPNRPFNEPRAVAGCPSKSMCSRTHSNYASAGRTSTPKLCNILDYFHARRRPQSTRSRRLLLCQDPA